LDSIQPLLEHIDNGDVNYLEGLTLAERRCGALRAQQSERHNAVDREPRVALWRSWFTGGSGGSAEWNTFLRITAINESQLGELLEVRRNPPANLSWIPILRELRAFLGRSRFRVDCSLSFAEQLAEPTVQFAWNQAAACSIGPRLRSLLSNEAMSELKVDLRRRLARSVRGIAEWEWQAFLATPVLIPQKGVSPAKASDAEMFFSTGVESETLRCVECYPALARLWCVQVEYWLQFLTEFANHLEEFVRTLAPRVANASTPVRSLRLGLSDLHNGNKTVLRVRLSNGRVFFYKPRSGAYEFEWFNLLRSVNEAGFEKPFKLFTVNNGATHCWMEGVKAAACANEEEVKSYFFRAGALLYLIHTLRGVDIHAGNVVAQSCYPVIVDCETLLHSASIPPAFQREEGSIIRTGMLPIANRDHQPIDSVSALGRARTGHHSVRLNKRNVPSYGHIDDISTGFRAIHRFVKRQPCVRKAIATVAARLQEVPVRRIYRPTAHYVNFLERSTASGALKCGLNRSVLLYALCMDGMNCEDVLIKEVLALENGDIPMQTGLASEPVLLSDGDVAEALEVIRNSLSPAR
jgi:hypothetical protein